MKKDFHLKIYIKLIEGTYPRNERNTPKKMQNLIYKDYKELFNEKEIMICCGVIVEDWEEITNKIENGN